MRLKLGEKMIPSIVYLLCALTSLLCAGLLIRSYRRTKGRLLFWNCVFFTILALSNILLFVDLVLIPTTIDLSLIRTITTLSGVLILLYGLIWEGLA
jgi:hypothetical protein